MTIRMHKKIKITVLRTEYYQELAEQYAIPNLGKCPFHQKGQVLYSDGINPPDGMCGVAWQVIAPMARQLSLSDAISEDLKKRGMKFVGTIIIYAYLQAVGVINSHESGCFLNPLQQ